VLSGGEETNWSRRYKANQEKLASGNLVQVAQVVRDLAERDASRGLLTSQCRVRRTRGKLDLAVVPAAARSARYER
jgi:CarD family transcriptional regulator